MYIFLAAALAMQAPQQVADAKPVRPHTTVTDKTPASTPTSSSPEHDTAAPKARAARLTGSINIDGQLNDAAWAAAPVVTDLHQTNPNEGVAPSLRTEVRVLFDNEYIYVGARMFDDQPNKIVGRLARRDSETGSDYILIQFDPYHNHNGDASFSLTPSGLRWDGGNGDVSWDPVWEGKAHVDSLGWTAEMRIPFSQLRFKPGSKADWGFQVERFINRLNENDTWSFWKRSEQGGPARWGHIEGIESPSKVPGRAELMPYVASVGQLHANVAANDPFAHKREGSARAGLDMKYQVTSTLTLSATVNPDFGQAEVDPAVVNLSAFETFFDEKREFFIEGRDKFGFGTVWCFTCSNYNSLSMLSTRRIGRAPQAGSLANGDYVNVPEQTTILGAAKLTGRTSKGWNIGVLNAVTAREKADIRVGVNKLEQEVEPATNYFVGRAKRDLEHGNLRVGGIFTSVTRNFSDDAVKSLLNAHSEGMGADAEYWWHNRTYHLLAQYVATNISGTPAAVLRAQRSSARYFQRPDRGNGSNGLFSDAYDTTLTSMRGFGSYMRVAKEGGSMRWETSFETKSPGLENNDIANLTRADLILMHGNLNKRWLKPTKYYRNANLTVGGQQQFNYDGDLTARQAHASGYLELPNYWSIGAWGALKPDVLDDRKTRGGPVVGAPGERDMEINMSGDGRKPIAWAVGYNNYQDVAGGHYTGGYASLQLRPRSNVQIELGPNYSLSKAPTQYIRSVTDATATNFYGKRYVFSSIESKTLSMDTRLNVTFTPTMSLQLFAQPFISSNAFSDYKQFAQVRDWKTQTYGKDVGTVTRNGKTITIDPDGVGPAASFSVQDPNFTFRSLRGNAVFRWEYKPGSTLYLVWTQDRSSEYDAGDLNFGRDRRALFSSPADHVFLVKVNYWLPM